MKKAQIVSFEALIVLGLILLLTSFAFTYLFTPSSKSIPWSAFDNSIFIKSISNNSFQEGYTALHSSLPPSSAIAMVITKKSDGSLVSIDTNNSQYCIGSPLYEVNTEQC